MRNRREYKAACRGCHGGCVHILTVEDGRLVKVRPDPASPLNRGRACVKGMSIVEQMYHPERIIYPMRRVGPKRSGQWERITWDEAYDLIAEKLTALAGKYGPESVAMITGTGRHHMAHYNRFANVFGTPNPSSSGALICLGPRVTAGMVTAGSFAGVDYYGDVKPRAILVWGGDPSISGADGELQWMIRDAVRDGVRLVVVDPRPTYLAREAEVWLKVRPGTDGALAMGMLRMLLEEDLYDRAFVENWCVGLEELRERVAPYTPERVAEITDIAPEELRRAVELIASVKPLGLEWGCAVEQNINAIQTCRAIYMIPALTGNWDVPGGFVPSMDIAPTADELPERLSPETKAKGIYGPYFSTKNRPVAHPYMLLDAIRTGKPYKIRALMSHANNALLSLPDSRHTFDCLSELEFFVYMDFFRNPTAEFADILLPAALWPEIDEVYCMPEFGEQALLRMRQVVRVGECKSDEEFFLELSRRMGLDYGADSLESIYQEQLDEMIRRRPQYQGLTFEKLNELGWVEPERTYRNYEKSGFRTPSGKFEFRSTALEQSGGDPLPFWVEPPETPVSDPETARDFPLILTTGGRVQQYFISNNRQIRSLRRQAPFPLVSMCPETAAQYDVAEGEWIWIETRRGRITQKVKLLPDMKPGVVNCEMGWWYPEAGAPGYGWDESNANVLTIGDTPHDPFGGSYQLRALLCRIYKNETCDIESRYEKWMAGKEDKT